MKGVREIRRALYLVQLPICGDGQGLPLWRQLFSAPIRGPYIRFRISPKEFKL